MNQYWSDIIQGGKSLVTGLSITAKEFFKKFFTGFSDRFHNHIT